MAKSRHKSNRQRSQVGSGGGLQDASFLECPDCGNPIGNHNWKSSRGKTNARKRSVRTSSRKGSTGQRSYIRRRYTRSPSRLRAKRGAKRCAKRGGRRTARSRSTRATRSRRSASGKLRGRRSKIRGKRGRGKSTRGRNVSKASSHARSVCSSSRVRCQRSSTRKQQSQSAISRKGSTNKRRYVRPCRGVRTKRGGRRTARSRSSQSQSTQSQSTTPRKGSINKRRYVRKPANRRGRAKRGARRTVTRSLSSTSSSSRGRSSTSTGKQRAKQSTNRYKRGRGTKYYRGRRQASRTSRKSKSSRPTKVKRSRRPTRLGICTCCHNKIKSTDSTQALADPEQELATPDIARLSSSSPELSIREEQEQPSTTEAPEQQERPSSELSLGEPLTNVPISTPLMVDDDNNRIPIPETNTAPEVRTIIFRPTIVIVQNVFVLPGQLQASSSIINQSLNVVNVVNQEVFIFPNSNELPLNIGAQYGLMNAPSTNQIQTVSPASSPVPSSSVAPQSSATSDKPVLPQ